MAAVFYFIKLFKSRFSFHITLCFLISFSYFSSNAENKNELVLVILGDSISEGYGVATEKSFPKLLETKLKNQKYKISIINSSISGSTSASAEKRIKWILKSKPNYLIIELGANDALRGLNPLQTEKNLSQAIKLAKQENIKIILAGMKSPPNYGLEYSKRFEKIFSDLASKEKVILVPFILEGIAGVSTLNQADGIHPNEKGHEIIAEKLYKIMLGIL